MTDRFILGENEELDTGKVRILLEKVNEFYAHLSQGDRAHLGNLARKVRLAWLAEQYLSALEELDEPLEGVTLTDTNMTLKIPAGSCSIDMPPMIVMSMPVSVVLTDRTSTPVVKSLFFGEARPRIVVTPAGTDIANWLLATKLGRGSLRITKNTAELREIAHRNGVLSREGDDIIIYVKRMSDICKTLLK